MFIHRIRGGCSRLLLGPRGSSVGMDQVLGVGFWVVLGSLQLNDDNGFCDMQNARLLFSVHVQQSRTKGTNLSDSV